MFFNFLARSWYFAVPADHRVKLKECEKKDKSTILPILFFFYYYYNYYYYYYFTSCKVFTPVLAGRLWVESEWHRVSQILLSILVLLNNIVVWMASILPWLFNCSNPLFKHLGTIPKVPAITGITISCMFNSFFSSLARSKYLSIFSLSFIFTSLFLFINSTLVLCPVRWGCRIHWLFLCRGVRPRPMSVMDMTRNNLML